jgi:hypothetical protein
MKTTPREWFRLTKYQRYLLLVGLSTVQKEKFTKRGMVKHGQ